jgi:xanthine dehydrogenase accessory factor
MQWSELAAFYQADPARRVALVTLVAKSGSSYRQPGARMLVRTDGTHGGTVSAGCLEDEIARAAVPVLADGRPHLLTIDTRPHYGCPGQITLLLEALDPAAGRDFFQLITTHLQARRTFTVATDYTDLTRTGPLTHVLPGTATSVPAPRLLLERVGRQPRLIVIGDGADATALAKAALLARWEVHVIVPTDIQFAPEQIVARHAPDDRTAVVLMTHNLGHDVACLHALLPHAYSYLGVIGSTRRRSELVNGLESAGADLALAALDRLCCPAGLDLGANEAGEIAISILAEIQCGWSGRNAAPLRDRARPIHSHDPAR